MGTSCIVREDLCGCLTCASCAGGALAGLLHWLPSLRTPAQADARR